MTYKYSQIHTVTTSLLNLGVPLIPAMYKDEVFTIILRNTGGADAVLSLIGAIGDLFSQTVPGGNNGVVIDNVGYDAIAGGVQGQSSGASTTVHISIISLARQNVNVVTAPPVVTAVQAEQAALEAQKRLAEERDYFEVTV
jgi:hypothetical protein